MDGEPLATSIQNARKSDKDIRFVSRDAAEKVRNFIVSLQEIEEPGVQIVDLEQEMGATMTVKYSGHLLDDRGYYMGQPVQVARQYHRYVDNEIANCRCSSSLWNDCKRPDVGLQYLLPSDASMSKKLNRCDCWMTFSEALEQYLTAREQKDHRG